MSIGRFLLAGKVKGVVVGGGGGTGTVACANYVLTDVSSRFFCFYATTTVLPTLAKLVGWGEMIGRWGRLGWNGQFAKIVITIRQGTGQEQTTADEPRGKRFARALEPPIDQFDRPGDGVSPAKHSSKCGNQVGAAVFSRGLLLCPFWSLPNPRSVCLSGLASP